jgi:molybdate transport system substrate-binding protein
MSSDYRLILLVVMCMLALTGCSQANSSKRVTLNVSGAASLTDALKEIEDRFEKENPSIDVVLNLASSGTLQRQIEQGAPADVFLSASLEKFNALREKGLLDEHYTDKLLENELVVITEKDDNLKLDNLHGLTTGSEIERIAIGVPTSVPAGRYAKESLEHKHLWDDLEKKMVYGKDVRQVLTYVETGNVDVGFVYATDAVISDDVEVIHRIDSSLHTPIIYPAGIIDRSDKKDAALSFYTFLKTEKAQETFKKYGFIPFN